jgi:hypothetical protein
MPRVPMVISLPCSSALLLSVLVSMPVMANVLTELLSWRAPSVERGLDRLRDEFLSRSIAQDAEFVGAVFRTRSGEFEFTQGQGPRGQNQVTFRIRRTAGQELVGFWHTHGANRPSRGIFSPTDARLVRRTGLPFYLIRPDGEIRVLKPEHVADRDRVGLKIGAFARLPRGSHPGESVAARPGGSGGDVIGV